MPEAPRILSITELTRTVRELVEGVVGEVWVEGEVANHRKQASGHQYFTLKDDRCQLSCVLFHRPGLRRATIPLSDGMQVQARGVLTVYEARGQYQLNVSMLQAAGVGLLAAKFEALKQKLATEGLFAPERKRRLPKFPRAIGLVTSPTGAALRDMLNILARRAPWVPVYIYPARVQGAGAAEEIAGGVAAFNSGALPPVDLIVITRGGGSTEDLWEFNDEALARTVFASHLPVVSAVGHEIDFSIADFVADLRAPTPSAAAELIVPDSSELAQRLGQWAAALERSARQRVQAARHTVAALERTALFRDPAARLDTLRQRVDLAAEALARAAREAAATHARRLEGHAATLREHRPDQLLHLRRQEVDALSARLRQAAGQSTAALRHRLAHGANLLRVLGPQATLERGYSITRNEAGEIIRSTEQTPPGTHLRTRLAEGEVRSITE